jgi:benzoate membrane transport protein
MLRDFSGPAFWAGLTAVVWYAFGAVPLQMAVSAQLGLTPEQSSSWIFIVWFSGAIASIVLTLYYRQPIPITWTIPGLIYLGTLAGQFSFGELVGANLVAGLIIVVLGLFGVGGRIMTWLPLPIVMGMFGGSILGYATRLVKATVGDLTVAGTTVAGYLLARFIGSPRVPPVGVAVVFGAAAALWFQRITPAPVSWGLPALVFPEISITLPAIVAVSFPMIVLAMGLGNVQGLGFLLAQGYRVPVNSITVAVGINSVINAFLGGHPAIVARTGVAILASPAAGPLSTRYWSNLVASALLIFVAFAATPVTSLLQILPRPYILALAGLAILSALQDAFEKAFGGPLKFGSLVALAVAATPFELGGITSAFWAIIAGLAAALLAERGELFAYWRREDAASR